MKTEVFEIDKSSVGKIREFVLTRWIDGSAYYSKAARPACRRRPT